MELLTGKAKEAFEDFNRKNEFDQVFMDKINTDVNTLFKLHQLYQQSVIIYWLDSVGVYVKIQTTQNTIFRVQNSPIYGLVVNKSNLDDYSLIVSPRSSNEISIK